MLQFAHASMLANDRVLVAYVPNQADFERVCSEKWYRIPVAHAPKGVYAEWVAFYFGRKHPQYANSIAFLAQNRGHELVLRRDLLPEQPKHPRADDWYFKLQLGEILTMDRPILAQKWRRILFIHTTGDRFQQAQYVHDLLSDDPQFVPRTTVALREEVEQPYVVLEKLS